MSKSKNLLHFYFTLNILTQFSLSFFFLNCKNQEQKQNKAAYVSNAKCLTCHQTEANLWQDSDHRWAMDTMRTESVRGDFSNQTFSEGEFKAFFFKKDNRYFVKVTEHLGDTNTYEAIYTFGWRPLQQYLFKTDKGRLQAFPVAWDTEKKRWFSCQNFPLAKSGDWLHWKGEAYTGNSRCISCHTTNFTKDFNPKTNEYHSKWSEAMVSCQSCHGPGAHHVNWAESKGIKKWWITKQSDHPYGLIPNFLASDRVPASEAKIQDCMPCHSLREQFQEFKPGTGTLYDFFGPLLVSPERYHLDGQIREENYEWGSFMQSKMFQKGVSCKDCHDVHSLKVKSKENSLCTSCHQHPPQTFETPAHTKHPVSANLKCWDCHMPQTTYMGNDPRRDHRFHIPISYEDTTLGIPNACEKCHSNQGKEWVREKLRNWPSLPKREAISTQYIGVFTGRVSTADIAELQNILNSPLFSDFNKATLVNGANHTGIPLPKNFNLQQFQSMHPVLKATYCQNFKESNPEDFPFLKDCFEDSVFLVRQKGFQAYLQFLNKNILGLSAATTAKVEQEYVGYLNFNSDSPLGNMNAGLYWLNKTNPAKAIEHFQNSLTIDPYFFPAAINLAQIYSQINQVERAIQLLENTLEKYPDQQETHYSLGLLFGERKQYSKAIYHLEQVLQLGGNPRVFYNLGVLYTQAGQLQKAEAILQRGLTLDPGSEDLLNAIAFLRQQKSSPQK